MNWTDEQFAVFEFIKDGRGNGLIDAVAGSGKTSTLLEALTYIPKTKSALFCAFNKAIETEIKKKLQSTGQHRIETKTMHALGWGCYAKAYGTPTVEEYKYASIIQSLNERNNYQFALAARLRMNQQIKLKKKEEKERVWSHDEWSTYVWVGLIKLVDTLRLTGSSPEQDNVQTIAEKYALPINTADSEELALFTKEVKKLLEIGENRAKVNNEIDFVDMLYLPYHLNLQPRRRYDFLFVDECQDLSRIQFDLALKMLNPGGRLLAVGDPQQSIYGFAGADPDSFNRFEKELNPKKFTLSTCFRCAASFVELAKDIRPDIKPRDDAQEGVLITTKAMTMISYVQHGDLILCRKNAPLVELCIQLISKGIAATVKGKDIVKGLTAIIFQLSEMEGFSYRRLLDYLFQFEEEQLLRLGNKPANENKRIQLEDQCRVIDACFRAFNSCNSTTELCNKIDTLFKDGESSVTLSTVHKAKGLENDRVIILEYTDMPLNWEGQLAWQFQQEENLRYVALTRAKNELILVEAIEESPILEELIPPY